MKEIGAVTQEVERVRVAEGGVGIVEVISKIKSNRIVIYSLWGLSRTAHLPCPLASCQGENTTSQPQLCVYLQDI